MTVLQPWASLIADGFKTVESRSWSTNYRGPLAIHAGIGRPDHAVEFEQMLDVRHRNGPLGVIVATCRLVDVRSTDLSVAEFGAENAWRVEYEKTLGDFTAGRYAWFLDDIVPLEVPIPAKGILGLWEWTPPENLRQEVSDNVVPMF